MMSGRYALDRTNGKLLGVCAGLSLSTGWNANAIRVGTVLLTLLVFGPVAILLYLVAFFVANGR